MANLTIEEGIPLSRYCTFKIGGPALFFTKVFNAEEMKQALIYAKSHDLPFFILGKGSNLLFDDRGFKGLVILNKIEEFLQNQDIFSVGSGYSFSRLGIQSARLGFSGLEFAGGIPGTVGGALFMNAGANKQETSTFVKEVHYMHQSGDLEIFQKDSLTFSYRTSSFQNLLGAIVHATFLLQPSLSAQVDQKNILDYRKKTQPLKAWSAGCVFRNPVEGSAGALIEQCGLKGMRLKGALVSTDHANFLVNDGSATAEGILELIQKIQEKVKAEKDISLEMEVRYVPYV